MKRPSLWLPFTALGLAGGCLVAQFKPQAAWGALPIIFTPILCALLGGFKQCRMGRWWLPVVSTIVTAFLLSTVVAQSEHDRDNPSTPLLGVIFCVLPFLLATPAVAFAWRRVRAPAETAVGRAQRRGIWTTTAFFIAAAATAVARQRRFNTDVYGGPPAELAIGASIIVALMLVRDVGELLRLRRLAARVRSMPPRLRPLAGILELGAQRIDLGAGDGIFDELEVGEPFRGVDRLRCTVHGDPGLAIRAIGWATARDAALLGLAIAGLASILSAQWPFVE